MKCWVALLPLSLNAVLGGVLWAADVEFPSPPAESPASGEAIATEPALADVPPGADEPIQPPSAPPRIVDGPVPAGGFDAPSLPPSAPPARPRGVIRPTAPAPHPPIPKATRRGEFTISLKDGTRLIGRPVELTHFAVGTSFGDVRIPLTVIAGMQTVPKRAEMKIRFHNGDLVSGTLKTKTMRFKTAYGEIRIPLSAVVEFHQGAIPSTVRRSGPTGGRSVVKSRRRHSHPHTTPPSIDVAPSAPDGFDPAPSRSVPSAVRIFTR